MKVRYVSLEVEYALVGAGVLVIPMITVGVAYIFSKLTVHNLNMTP